MRRSEIVNLLQQINKKRHDEAFVKIAVEEKEINLEAVIENGEEFIMVPKILYEEFKLNRAVGSLMLAIYQSGFKEINNLRPEQLVPEAPWKNLLRDIRIQKCVDKAKSMGLNVPVGGEK